MEYRDWTEKDGIGRDISTSLLGYGCMRFPTLPDGRIDEVRAEKLLNTARAAGVNYFDTAFPYHGGESEPFVGRVIAKWPRESFYLATKLPLWSCKTLDEAKDAIGPKTARWGRVIFPIFRESILSLVLLDNGLQKLHTINKKGTACEWSASFQR